MAAVMVVVVVVAHYHVPTGRPTIRFDCNETEATASGRHFESFDSRWRASAEFR